jgi:hypothetical protein
MARLPRYPPGRLVPVRVAAPSYAGKRVKGMLVRSLLLTGAVDPDGVRAAAANLRLPVTGDDAGLTLSVPTAWQPPA